MTASSTRMRFAAVQAWALLRIFARRNPSTAASRSASANTTNGALPPSSIEQGSTRAAAPASRSLPTSVDPVNESLRTRKSASIADTTSALRVVGRTVSTPGGTPASASRPASASAVSGVSVAGFRTPQQPAASAGATLRVTIAAGKFQGVTRSAVPTGLRTTTIRCAPPGAVAIEPSMRTASSEYQRRNSAA